MKTYTVKVDDELTVRWYNDKQQLERGNGPAVEYNNGDKLWCVNGKLHRDDGPAIEFADGNKYWYINGKCHRVNGPAIEYANGDKLWYVNGKCHRDDGPAIELVNGGKYWFLNDKEVTESEVMRLNETIDIEGTKYTLAQIKAALKKNV